jgi:hypothetical protein
MIRRTTTAPASIPVPTNLTVEEAKRFVSRKEIVIGVDSIATLNGKTPGGNSRWDLTVKQVTIKQESEMKPELFLAGPTRRGEVNLYIGIDGNRHVFSALTGEAIGSEMRPIQRTATAEILPRQL